MIIKQWRKVYSNDEENRREATIDIHIQQIYGSWEMEKRVVTDEGGGGQWVNPKWEATEKAAYFPSRTISGLRESMGLDSVEKAGGTAMVEKRNGQQYMEQSIPKQHLLNWKVQWPQRRDFHVYYLESSTWHRFPTQIKRNKNEICHLTSPVSLLNMKNQRPSDIWRKASSMKKRQR